MDFIQFLQASKKQQIIDKQPIGGEKEILKEYKIFRGTRVVIKRKENSIYNHYKGYRGEVKFYKENMEYALIMLEGLPNVNQFKFELDHFDII
jgi:hypothetical protein